MQQETRERAGMSTITELTDHKTREATVVTPFLVPHLLLATAPTSLVQIFDRIGTIKDDNSGYTDGGILRPKVCASCLSD